VLTTAGIVLGVSVLVGMQTANKGVLSAFSHTIDSMAGKTELQVTAGDAGFGEDVLEKVQSAATVRVAVPVIEAVVDSRLSGEGNLFVLAVDMTGDGSLRDYDLESGDVIDDPLVFLAQPDSLIVSKEFAVRNHLASGSRIALGAVDGEKIFTIRGLMKSSGLASAFGGNLAIVDIYAAQKMFGRGRTFDRIDLAVTPGRTLEECQRELAAMLGPAFEIQAPATRGQQFQAVLAGYSLMMTASSAFALLIGMFIIYNSFGIAVTQRRSEIGILRALGASRGTIRGLFLAESAWLGLIGSLAGLGVGVFVARLVASSVSRVVTDVYFISQQANGVSVSPVVMATALVVGVCTSVVAAWIPAASAARGEPVHALQKGKSQVLATGESRHRAMFAAGLAVISVACLTASGSRATFYVGYVSSIFLIPVVLGPMLSLGLARVIRPALRRLRPVEGALAADSLIQTPRRTSASVVALTLSLALVVAFSGMARASYDSILDWVNVTFNPDLFVSPTPNFNNHTTRFPPSMAPEIAAIPGVARVQMFRMARIIFRNKPISVIAVEMDSVEKTAPRPPIAGNAHDMYRKAAAGEGLIVSDNLAQMEQLALGDIVEVPAPYGLLRLPIVGIIVDYSDQQGMIALDRQVFIRFWHDDSVRDFRVYVSPGADVSNVRQLIIERYAGRRQVFVLTNTDLKAYILGLANQWFGLTWVQIAVAGLIAILGIANTLTVSVIDRRREFGVLRAVGALRGQIRITIWIEAISLALFGLILGLALGAINLYYLLEIVHRDIAGWRLAYHFPLGVAALLAPMVLVAAVVAAIWPAEAAVRGSLIEALEYE
jgi:putative ABC transport system permease protein